MSTNMYHHALVSTTNMNFFANKHFKTTSAGKGSELLGNLLTENETMSSLLINKWALLPVACGDEK